MMGEAIAIVSWDEMFVLKSREAKVSERDGRWRASGWPKTQLGVLAITGWVGRMASVLDEEMKQDKNKTQQSNEWGYQIELEDGEWRMKKMGN
jgi:hypothetical protein